MTAKALKLMVFAHLGQAWAPSASLPESQYLLHAGSDRVGALDIRQAIHDDEPTQGASGTHARMRCAANGRRSGTAHPARGGANLGLP